MDIPEGFVYPTETAWQRAGERGQKAVHEALCRVGINMAKPGKNTALLPAPAMGALVAIGGYLRAIGNPDHPHVLEGWAMATLRGALRGSDGPIHDDGRPFTQATDA